MEKRAVLAAVLMAGLVIIYQALFIPSPAPDAPAPAKTEAPAPPPATQAPPSAPAPGPVAPVPAASPMVSQQVAIIETPLYRAAISSQGGQLREWELRYRGSKPMVVPDLQGPAGVFIERPGTPARPIEFALSTDRVILGAGNHEGELSMTGEDGFGLRVTRKLRFRSNSYLVDDAIVVENRHTVPQGGEVVLAWTAPVEWTKDQPEKFQGQHLLRVVGHWNGHVRRQDLASAATQVGDGKWVGLESEWYLAALIPRTPGMKLMEEKPAAPAPGGQSKATSVRAGLRVSLPVLQPGNSWQGAVQLYAGPKEYDQLKALGVSLEKSIYFGGFPLPESYGGLPMEWVVVPVLWLMHWFYSFTGNYGIAIILLTVIAKVLFFPLSVKSMKSMKAMQALQPQVNALRAKHKNEPQKLQQETMELYRAQGVNPLGGCLPMVVQVPIFYALYVALAVSVELQNAPFLCFGRLFGMDLWICDLAAQDPTYILPILMGVSMFIQQKMTPITGDPRQAKMMLFMPVVFTFMFLNLPSGLVLYWTLSNVLQIAQQYYMNQVGKTAKAPARAAKKA